MNNKHYELATVVDDWADDNNLRHLWHKGYKWAIRGLKRIRMDVHQHPACCLLTVSERKTVILPDRFVDWVIVAMKHGQYAITLSVNDELTIQRRVGGESTVKGLLSQNMPNGTDFNNYGGYRLTGHGLSIGGGISGKGSFKIVDRGSCREMLLDYDYPLSQVYVEYVSDGIDDCDVQYIHPYEYEFLLAFMDMMYEKKNNPKATIGSKRETEIDVEVEERKLRARYNDLGPKDILNMSRVEARVTTKL